MSNSYFQFKQFTIEQDRCAFKVGTDGVILGAAADVKGAERILDIGSGTGLIAIMLAQRSAAEIVAIEPDKDSFSQLEDNVRRCPWSNRISVVNTDLQNYYADKMFDLVVTNPPYFTDSLKNPDTRKAMTRHTDTLHASALLGGVSGLLSDAGIFQLILPYAEGNVFIAGASSYGFFCNGILKVRPLPSSDVRRLVLTFSRIKKPAAERFLTIEHGRRHEFTEEYKELTRDFYLRF